MSRLLAILTMLPALACLAACAVPPRPADPAAHSNVVRAEFFRADHIPLHLYSVNGARLPDRALARSIKTIERHTGRPIHVIDHGDVAVPADAQGDLTAPPSFPIRDGGRVISADEIAPESRLLFAAPDHGILGAAAVGPRRDQAVIRPIIEPGVIVIASLPGPSGGRSVTGYAAALPTADPQVFRLGMVVLHASAIDRRSGLFVSRDKLYEWTLTHEIGHILGVPADNSHIWPVPGLGHHCTHPECIMYTGLDWRVVLSGLLHGWPLDFCRLCAGELKAARDAAIPPPEPEQPHLPEPD